MEKQFKKVFIEYNGDEILLNKGVDKLKSLGYTKHIRGVEYPDKTLIGREDGYYYSVSIDKKGCVCNGYEEIFLEEKAEEHLQSTQSQVGRYVTQIIHFSQGNKRTIKGIDTHTIKQGQFTKFYTKTGILVSINDKNVDMIETFTE